MPGARSSVRVNFVLWRMIFLDTQYLLHATVLTSGIFKWIIDLWKICGPLFCSHILRKTSVLLAAGWE